MKNLSALAGLALCALPVSAQDTVSAGFSHAGRQALPAPFAAYHTLSDGNRVAFDGSSIDLYDGGNNHLLHLGDVPSFVFASFVEANPSETFALVGESSNGDVFKVFLDGSGMSTLANLPFNYDAAFEAPNHALVSASTCGFGCGNDVVRVNTNTGATTFVAHVTGASGPLAFAADGALLYATVSDQFPAPPGSTDIVFWTATQLHSGTLLDLGDSTVFHPGLNAAASLAVDPVFGNVFLAESVFGSTSEILEFTKQGDLVGPVVASPDFLSNLELRADGGPGHFHAFQPPDGIFLHYSNGDLATVRPARPLGALHPMGATTVFEVTGALPNSSMLVLWSGQQGFDPNETAYPLFPDFLFVTGIPLDQLRKIPSLIPIDANGVGTFSFSLQAGDPGRNLVFQALLRDQAGTRFIATSTAALN